MASYVWDRFGMVRAELIADRHAHAVASGGQYAVGHVSERATYL
jgi:hypothetical protein